MIRRSDGKSSGEPTVETREERLARLKHSALVDLGISEVARMASSGIGGALGLLTAGLTGALLVDHFRERKKAEEEEAQRQGFHAQQAKLYELREELQKTRQERDAAYAALEESAPKASEAPTGAPRRLEAPKGARRTPRQKTP